MSNNKNNNEISLGLIIFFMFIIPPVGALLLLVKIIQLLSGNRLSRKNRYSSYEKRGEEIFKEIWNDTETKGQGDNRSGKKSKSSSSESGSKTKNKIPYRTSSLVLLIIAGVLIFTGIMEGVPHLFESGLSALSTGDFGMSIAFLGIGGVLGGIGLSLRRKMKLIKKYLSVVGKRGCVKIDELAKSFSLSRSKVKKELQTVIDSGVFGEYAYIDLGNNLFLRDSSFKPADEEPPKNDTWTQSDNGDGYSQTLHKIRQLNDLISDDRVSLRIEFIEKYTGQIFEYVKKNPDREKDVHMFMTYYLPTTLKLLESYSEIERVGVAGDNMRSAKDNIEKTLDLLVEAYKKLLDQLYQSENMDISSDIDVLEQMMKKDGLTGSGFEV